MADATNYAYGRNRELLLRMNLKTRQLEIYRPTKDTWDDYEWDGAVETWYDCTDVSPDHVDPLKASLRELEESMNPAPPVYEFDTNSSNLHWGSIWASVQFDSDREIWNVSAGIEGCLLGVLVADGFDDETHAENYAEDFEAGRVCIVDPTPAREWLRMIGLADMAKKFDTDVREHLEFMARKWLITPDGERIGLFEVGNIYKQGGRISREPNLLTMEVAEQFLKDSDSVQLGELTAIDDEAAESLSKYEGNLDLDGLTSLSDAAAESLSKHEGDLYLDSLTSLSDAAIESLSAHKGDLILLCLMNLSDAAAESLSKHEGRLILSSLTGLSDAAAESLCKHEGELNLDGLTSLSDASAESLSKHVGELYLDSLTSLSDAAMESLSKHKGTLCLSGLTDPDHVDTLKACGETPNSEEFSSATAETIANAITWSFREDCPMGAHASTVGNIVVSYGQASEKVVELELVDGQWFASRLFDAGSEIPRTTVHNYEEVLDYVSAAITARYHYVERRPPGHVKFHP